MIDRCPKTSSRKTWLCAATGIMLNSKKNILKDNYQLHFAYCSKNVISCSYCGEYVEAGEVEAHISKAQGQMYLGIIGLDESQLYKKMTFLNLTICSLTE